MTITTRPGKEGIAMTTRLVQVCLFIMVAGSNGHASATTTTTETSSTLDISRRRLGGQRFPRDYVDDIYHCDDPEEVNDSFRGVRCNRDTYLWNLNNLNPNRRPLFCPNELVFTGPVPDLPDAIEPCFLWDTIYGNLRPSASPTIPSTTAPSTLEPTSLPTVVPTVSPSTAPSHSPSTAPSHSPSTAPSHSPSMHPTPIFSDVPTFDPSVAPSSHPTEHPTPSPSLQPTIGDSKAPSAKPVPSPTYKPTTVIVSSHPTSAPSYPQKDYGTLEPTLRATAQPTAPTLWPTAGSTSPPTRGPTGGPTLQPTSQTTPLILQSDPATLAPTQQPTQGRVVRGRATKPLTPFVLSFFIAPALRRKNRRQLLTFNREELHNITTVHLSRELRTTLGDSVVGVDLIFTSVQARVLDDGTIIVSESLGGNVIFVAGEEVRRSTLTQLVDIAFKGTAMLRYMRLTREANDPVLRRTFEIRVGADLPSFADFNPDDDPAAKETKVVDTSTIAILAAVAAATMAAALMAFLAITRARRRDKRNRSADGLHIKKSRTSESSSLPPSTVQVLGRPEEEHSIVTSAYSFIEDVNQTTDDQSQNISIAPSLLYSIVEGAGPDDDMSTPSRSALWSVVDAVENASIAPQDSMLNNTTLLDASTKAKDPRDMVVTTTGAPNSESPSKGTSSFIVFDDDSSHLSAELGGGVSRVLELESSTPPKPKRNFEDIWKEMDELGMRGRNLDDAARSPKRTVSERLPADRQRQAPDQSKSLGNLRSMATALAATGTRRPADDEQSKASSVMPRSDESLEKAYGLPPRSTSLLAEAPEEDKMPMYDISIDGSFLISEANTSTYLSTVPFEDAWQEGSPKEDSYLAQIEPDVNESPLDNPVEGKSRMDTTTSRLLDASHTGSTEESSHVGSGGELHTSNETNESRVSTVRAEDVSGDTTTTMGYATDCKNSVSSSKASSSNSNKENTAALPSDIACHSRAGKPPFGEISHESQADASALIDDSGQQNDSVMRKNRWIPSTSSDDGMSSPTVSMLNTSAATYSSRRSCPVDVDEVSLATEEGSLGKSFDRSRSLLNITATSRRSSGPVDVDEVSLSTTVADDISLRSTPYDDAIFNPSRERLHRTTIDDESVQSVGIQTSASF